MEGQKEDNKVLTKDEIKLHIKDFTSADPADHNSAGEKLKECSKNPKNVNRLFQAKLDSECRKIIDDVLDSRRDIAITLMSRMACTALTGNSEFNEVSLKDCRDAFYNAKKAERKQKLLDAVRFFALDTSSLQGEVLRYQLVGETGWVEVARACEDDLAGPATLVLDALKNFAGLPGLITAHVDSATMLTDAIVRGKEPEKLAGLRVASHVLSSLKQGLAVAPLSPQATAWLKKLRKKKILGAVMDCIDGSASRAFVVTAVRTLTDLTSLPMFLQELGERAANAFTGSVGVCFRILDNCDEEVVKVLLPLLMAWHGTSTNSRAALQGGPWPMARLVSLLDDQDESIVNGACVLIAWALQNDSTTREELVVHLGSGAGDALNPLLVHLGDSFEHTWCALHYLITKIVHDEDSAKVFTQGSVIDGLLSLINDSSEACAIAAATHCLQRLWTHSSDINNLLDEGNYKAIVQTASARLLVNRGWPPAVGSSSATNTDLSPCHEALDATLGADCFKTALTWTGL